MVRSLEYENKRTIKKRNWRIEMNYFLISFLSFICLVLVGVGIIIFLIAAIRYHRLLNELEKQINERIKRIK